MRPLLRIGPLVLVAVTGLSATASAQNRWVQHYHERVASFRSENAALPPGNRHVVLVGDSLTEGWSRGRIARYLPSIAGEVLNRGISSDRVGPPRGVLSRLDCSVFDTQPRHVVLLVGTNQIGRDGSGVRGAVAHYDQILTRLKARLPDVPVTVVTAPPARGSYDGLNPHIRRYNAELVQLAKKHGHAVLDLFALLVDDEGRLRADLTRDGLHFGDAGYALYGAAIEAAVAAAAAAGRPAEPGADPDPEDAGAPRGSAAGIVGGLDR